MRNELLSSRVRCEQRDGFSGYIQMKSSLRARKSLFCFIVDKNNIIKIIFTTIIIRLFYYQALCTMIHNKPQASPAQHHYSSLTMSAV
jgi:hypothetical protein